MTFGETIAILGTQVAWIVLAYWARVETFIAHPGRFRSFEAIVGSDLIVLFLPFCLAFFLLGMLLSRNLSLGNPLAYTLALVGTIATEFAALIFAFSTWGT